MMKLGFSPSLGPDVGMCDFQKLHGCNTEVMDNYGWVNGYPSDDVWNKFGFDDWTPPPSPMDFECGGRNESPWAENFLENSATSKIDDLVTDMLVRFPSSDLPDITDTCTEMFRGDLRHTEGYNQIKKDCMWNGRTDQKRSTTNRRSRSNSPVLISCSPSSGWIAPGSVFNNCRLNDRVKTPNPRRLRTKDGPETPSDSEEEVDVVTIEKKPTPPLLQPVSNINGSSTTKVFGTIVQQNGIHSHLSLVASSNNSHSDLKNIGKIENKSTTKTVSMVITNGDHKNGMKKTFHLTCVPLIGSNVASTNTTKRQSVSRDNKPAMLQLMRVTPTTGSNSASSGKENGFGVSEKRRVVSLDGVSMIADTGIKRVAASGETSSPNQFQIQPEPPLPSGSKAMRATSALLAEMKKTKKSTKRPAASLYESPTSSPDSSGGDSPVSPKRRTAGSRSSSSTSGSSGSDEDSIRTAHNVLERQRRQGLRNLYHVLRNQVPELAGSDKAPKVHILIKAKEHVGELHRVNAELQHEKAAEEQKKRHLHRRLQELAAELTSVNNISRPAKPPCVIKTEAFTFIEKFAISN